MLYENAGESTESFTDASADVVLWFASLFQIILFSTVVLQTPTNPVSEPLLYIAPPFAPA